MMIRHKSLLKILVISWLLLSCNAHHKKELIGTWCYGQENIRIIFKENNTFIPSNIMEQDSSYGEDAYELLSDSLLRIYPKKGAGNGLCKKFFIRNDTLIINNYAYERIDTLIRCQK